MNPQLPADVFTACLTTPIKMALHWFCQRTLVKDVNPDLIDKLPGRLNDRRTALGELNWYSSPPNLAFPHVEYWPLSC